MSLAADQRAARRAVDLDDTADLWDADHGKISVSTLAKQAVTAVLVGILGIVVVGGVSAVSAPYATAASDDTTTVTGALDRTVAVPQPVTNTDNSAASQSVSAADDAERNADITRSSIRSALNGAVAGELADQRTESLQQTGDQVSSAQQNSAADARAQQLSNQSSQITNEAARLTAEAQAKAAAAAAAAQAAQAAQAAKQGTLVAGGGKATPNTIDPSVLAALGSIQSQTGWVTPLVPGSYRIAAGFGEVGSWARYHTGVDFSAPIGTPIRAVGPGIVMPANGGGWAGTHVVIMHAGGAQSLYAHMAMTTVKVGQTVQAGQIIGYVGMTGRTFGPHCHFEYYPPGAQVGNPYTAANGATWLLSKGVRI